MTPRGGPLLHQPGGDNTPQGKLARGCGWLLAWFAIAIVCAGLADLAQHWWEGRLMRGTVVEVDPRDPRCDGPARYDAMREGADCSGPERSGQSR